MTGQAKQGQGSASKENIGAFLRPGSMSINEGRRPAEPKIKSSLAPRASVPRNKSRSPIPRKPLTAFGARVTLRKPSQGLDNPRALSPRFLKTSKSHTGVNFSKSMPARSAMTANYLKVKAQIAAKQDQGFCDSTTEQSTKFLNKTFAFAASVRDTQSRDESSMGNPRRRNIAKQKMASHVPMKDKRQSLLPNDESLSKWSKARQSKQSTQCTFGAAKRFVGNTNVVFDLERFK